MKKPLVVVIVVLALALSAVPSFAQGGPAAVIEGDYCYISVDGYGSLLADFHSVTTSSGNTSLVCKGTHSFALDKAVRAEGFWCNTFLGLTSNSQLVASPGGNVTLVCQINGSGN